MSDVNIRKAAIEDSNNTSGSLLRVSIYTKMGKKLI